MKALILITCFFLAVTCKAQDKKNIDSFLGIKFGSLPGPVIKGMKAKNAAEDTAFNNKYLTTHTLRFKNVSIGDRPCTTFSVLFAHDMVAQALFEFDPKPESITPKYYDDMVLDIANVYGTPEKNSPDYYDHYGNDKYKETAALKDGTKKYWSIWSDDAGNTIILSVIPDANYVLHVKLVYRDARLYDQVPDQQTTKSSGF